MTRELKKLMKEQTLLQKKLDALRIRIRSQLLTEAEFEEGDVVVVITEAYDLPQGLVGKGGPKHVEETRRIGQVQRLRPDVELGRVEYDIHPQTKNGGFHQRQTLYVGFGDRIEKYVEPEHE